MQGSCIVTCAFGREEAMYESVCMAHFKFIPNTG